MVHDSKFPGDDVPPLPHSSTWFEHIEDTNTQSGAPARTRNQNRRASPAGSDDDIAIERERISLKCPLTLTPYQDPMTSTKCPHSFEREAIMDMIKRSPTTIAPPASRRGQRRVHVVKCPVCSIPLTADDLRPDPVLLRRVRRAQELQEREEEDDHLEGDGRKQKDRSTGITLGSDVESDDDAMDVDAPPPSQRIKMEPLSQAARAAQSEDESSDDAESQDAEVEDVENAEGESPEGEDEEEQNDEEQNEEVGMEEPDNEESENEEVGIDGLTNEEAENEDVETDEGEIEKGQNEEEQNEEMGVDAPEPEGQNEEAQNEAVDSQRDIQQVDVQSEKGQNKDTSGTEDTEDSEDGDSEDTDSDSDIEPKIETGSEDEEVESHESD
jgi:AAA ATPase containing von Willebrand factor type A (vWA) domain